MPYLLIGDFRVEVLRKAVRHARLSVRPPAGHIRVTVPARTPDATVAALVLQKQAWIRKH